MRVAHRFEVAAGSGAVWGALADVSAVLSCIPGTEVIGRRDDGRYEAAIGVHYGPIRLEFRGIADVTYDAASRAVRIQANGRDRSGATRASADLSLGLEPRSPRGTSVALDGVVDLAGAIAHVPAAGSEAVLDRLMESFAERLAAHIEARGE
jgi:uncharacterized protein